MTSKNTTPHVSILTIDKIISSMLIKKQDRSEKDDEGNIHHIDVQLAHDIGPFKKDDHVGWLYVAFDDGDLTISVWEPSRNDKPFHPDDEALIDAEMHGYNITDYFKFNLSIEFA